jgi:2-methylcitrate dehydratase PrpD
VATPEKAVAGLGRDFHITHSGIKPYACCRTIHSVIDAVLELVGSTGRGAEVERFIVHGNAQTKLQFERTDVRNLLEAQFSMPYCLAVAAQSGRATLDQFEPLRTADPEIQRLMMLTEIRTDRLLGPTDYPSLEVVFKGGERILRDVPFAKGAPEAPVSDEELVRKARSLLVPVIGDAVTLRLIDGIFSLEGCADFSQLTRLLATPAGGPA